METSFLILLVICLYLIPLILCIILFFKIWGMTNDVKEINHNLFEIAKFIEESHNERANQNKE